MTARDTKDVVVKVNDSASTLNNPSQKQGSVILFLRNHLFWILLVPFFMILVINTMWYNTMMDFMPWNQEHSWLLFLHVWTVTVSLGLALMQFFGPTHMYLRNTFVLGMPVHTINGVVIYVLMVIGLLSGAGLARMQRYFQYSNLWYMDITDLNLLLVPSVGGYMSYAIYKMKKGDMAAHQFFMARAMFYAFTIYSTSRIVIYSVLAANGIYPTMESLKSFRWIQIQMGHLHVLDVAIKSTVGVTFVIIASLEIYIYRNLILKIVCYPWKLLKSRKVSDQTTA